MHKYALTLDKIDTENTLLSENDLYGDGYPDNIPAKFDSYIEAHLMALTVQAHFDLVAGSISIVTIENERA